MAEYSLASALPTPLPKSSVLVDAAEKLMPAIHHPTGDVKQRARLAAVQAVREAMALNLQVSIHRAMNEVMAGHVVVEGDRTETDDAETWDETLCLRMRSTFKEIVGVVGSEVWNEFCDDVRFADPEVPGEAAKAMAFHVVRAQVQPAEGDTGKWLSSVGIIGVQLGKLAKIAEKITNPALPYEWQPPAGPRGTAHALAFVAEQGSPTLTVSSTGGNGHVPGHLPPAPPAAAAPPMPPRTLPRSATDPATPPPPPPAPPNAAMAAIAAGVAEVAPQAAAVPVPAPMPMPGKDAQSAALKAFAELTGPDVAEWAKDWGVSVATIRNYFNGATKPKLTSAQAAEVSADVRAVIARLQAEVLPVFDRVAQG